MEFKIKKEIYEFNRSKLNQGMLIKFKQGSRPYQRALIKKCYENEMAVIVWERTSPGLKDIKEKRLYISNIENIKILHKNIFEEE